MATENRARRADRNQILAGRVPLDCVVFPAMFSTERKVILRIKDKEFITFADEELLTLTNERDPSGGFKARIWVKIRRNLPDGYVISLPEETLSSGELITVPKEMVSTAHEV